MNHEFDMKLKNYKEKETLKERGTKRYQERLAEEAEAEKEIKQYTQEEKAQLIDTDDNPSIS